MAPPPLPDPPPPPPPPLSSVMLAASGAPNEQQISLLLNSIRQGTKLKKTVTIDKSGPFIAGKVANVSNNNFNSESSRELVLNNIKLKESNLNGGPLGLGNLFAGGMPKLKPTGFCGGSAVKTSRENSPMKLLASESKHRGPPPQPPPVSHKPQISYSASDSVLTSTCPTNNTFSRPSHCSQVLSSKPPVGGYGKPNLAPKPPVQKESLFSLTSTLQPLTSTDHSGNFQSNCHSDQGKPCPPPKKISLNGRSGVNRAQSMKVPKSPPVAPNTSPPFPPNYSQKLVKNQANTHQSQDGLNSRNFLTSKTGTLPHNFQKMTIFPPSIPPPPAPSQRTPSRHPATKPPLPPSRPAPPPAPPPPPPHRTSPAPPPPPLQGRPSNMMIPIGSSAPPIRRNGILTYQTEIENKFGHLFHNIQEFPGPGAFRNLVKNYNTKASAIAKQPAPPPPVTATSVHLSNKMWLNNASHC